MTASSLSGRPSAPLHAVLSLTVVGAVALFAWKWWQERNEAGRPFERKVQGAEYDESEQNAELTGSTYQGSRPQLQNVPAGLAKRGQHKRKGRGKKDKQSGKIEPSTAISQAIAAKAAAVGMTHPAGKAGASETARETYVDFDKVSSGFENVVEWQRTGKKKH